MMYDELLLNFSAEKNLPGRVHHETTGDVSSISRRYWMKENGCYPRNCPD